MAAGELPSLLPLVNHYFSGATLGECVKLLEDAEAQLAAMPGGG